MNLKLLFIVATIAFVQFNDASFARTPAVPFTVPHFTLNGGFSHWKNCRANVAANSVGCNILIIGESSSTGHGSFFRETANNAHSGSWPNQLAAVLRLAGINAQTNSVMGDNNIAPYSTFDTRVTPNNWKAYPGAFVLGGSAWANTDTSPFAFNPTDKASYPQAAPVLTDTLDVYWVGQTSDRGGRLTVDADGSPICAINTAVPFQLTKTTCSTSLGAHTYNLRCETGHCAFTSIVARSSRANEVTILNGAADGVTISQFNSGSGLPWSPLASIAKFFPALCIIDEVGNDAGRQTSIGTYSAYLTALVTACKSSGADVLLTTGLPYGGDTTPITVEQYQAAVIAVAKATDVPVWDSFAAYGGTSGGWTASMTAGWNGSCCGGGADVAHWSIASNVYQATMISLLLMQ